MLLSFLYNKPIIDKYSAKNLGEINKIHINGRRIDYILTTKDIRIDASKICELKDAIIFDNDGRNYPDFKFFSVTNQLITDEKGKLYGNLTDLQITNKFQISKLITTNKNLCNVEVLSMSDDGLIFKRTKKAKSKNKSNSTYISSQDPACIVTTVTNYGFLIGRIIQKNIFVGGSLLFPIGKKINKTDIDIAIKYGKLIDITLYSKFYNIENL